MAQIKKQIAALNDAIEINTPSDSISLPTFQLPVGWAGTAVLEASMDDGVTYGALTIIANDAAQTKSVSVAAAGIYSSAPGSYDRVRLRVSVAGGGGIAALSIGTYGNK